MMLLIRIINMVVRETLTFILDKGTYEPDHAYLKSPLPYRRDELVKKLQEIGLSASVERRKVRADNIEITVREHFSHKPLVSSSPQHCPPHRYERGIACVLVYTGNDLSVLQKIKTTLSTFYSDVPVAVLDPQRAVVHANRMRYLHT